jgi:hypothetical protein
MTNMEGGCQSIEVHTHANAKPAFWELKNPIFDSLNTSQNVTEGAKNCLAESGDRDLVSARQQQSNVKGRGIMSVYYESPGTAHEWLMWRRHLREFAPLLFKD